VVFGFYLVGTRKDSCTSGAKKLENVSAQKCL
jgi:hypothetical protein